MSALLKKTEELLGKVEADNKKLVEERDEIKDKYKRSLGNVFGGSTVRHCKSINMAWETFFANHVYAIS